MKNFTFVEFLVVVAIIGIIAALLLPAFSAAFGWGSGTELPPEAPYVSPLDSSNKG